MRIGLMAAVVGMAGSLAMAGGNAALEYYRAWSVMDDTLQLTLITGGERMELTEDGAEKLRGGQDTIRMLLSASQSGVADWRIEYEDGPLALLPHLGRLRGSSKTLAADAIRCAADGDSVGAAERLAGIFRMCEDTSNDRVLISSMVSMAMSNLAIQLTNEMLEDGKLGEPESKVVLQAMKELRTDDRYGLRDAVVGEWRMIAEYLLMNAPEEGAGRWLLETMGMEADDAESKRIAAMDKDALMRELGGWSAFYSDMLGAWDAADRARMDLVVERLKDGEYGTLTLVMAASLTRAFDSNQQSKRDFEALIGRLEGIAD